MAGKVSHPSKHDPHCSPVITHPTRTPSAGSHGWMPDVTGRAPSSLAIECPWRGLFPVSVHHPLPFLEGSSLGHVSCSLNVHQASHLTASQDGATCLLSQLEPHSAPAKMAFCVSHQLKAERYPAGRKACKDKTSANPLLRILCARLRNSGGGSSGEMGLSSAFLIISFSLHCKPNQSQEKSRDSSRISRVSLMKA